MLTIGITGGIGSGKTIVCNIFRTLGVPVFQADEEARKEMIHNPLIKSRLQNIFGQDIYTPEGALNKNKISGIIFNDSKAPKKMNETVHPFVNQAFAKWYNSHRHQPYVIREAAILFESGSYKSMDKIVLVFCPEALRIQRIMERDGKTESEIQQIMKNQWTDGKKSKLSDYIIQNDVKRLVIPQVLELHSVFSNQ